MSAVEEIIEPELPICDPHHHLWDRPGNRYLLDDLLADVGSGHNIESTVYVEAAAFHSADLPVHMAPVGETEAANGAAAMTASGQYGRTRVAAGIVAFADLALGASVAGVLDAHRQAGGGRLRGIRHAGAWHESERLPRGHIGAPQGLYASSGFREGFAQLAEFGLTFDAWQFHNQLPEVADLASAFPGQPIILDHVGGVIGIGPYAERRDEVFAAWSADIRELAKRPNVTVKLGGLGMTICGFRFHKWESPPTSADLAEAWRPYVETCIEAFGAERCMFESNFPVDKASCSYATLWNAFKRLAAGASAAEKALLFRDVARRVYTLP